MTRIARLTGRRAQGLVALLIMAVGLPGGCTRRHYRLSADRETYQIIDAKTSYPQWTVPPFSIQPPPQSRNFDPYNPDCPPQIPDDPAAHAYMHCVDGIKGYHGWHKDGDAPEIEDPTWRKYLELSKEGVLVLDPNRSVQLALLNSREYQFELERLYLAALGLTLDRFEFDLHWFALNTTDYEHFGKGSTPAELNTLSNRSNLGFTRTLATGGQLLVDFANTVVWEFTGTDSNVTFSSLSVDLVQPLLRGAFKDVRLETLTQAERSVLYAARNYARFRKDFYFDIVSGDTGYLSLLLQVQGIRNLQSTLYSLEQNLRAHEALAEAGVVSPLQVDQVFQSFQNGRLGLIRAENNLETALDDYKIAMGLPPELAVQLDDSLLAPFQLNAPQVTELESRIEQVLIAFRELDEPPPLDVLRDGFAKLQANNKALVEQWEKVQSELDRWTSQPEAAADEDPLAQERETKTRQSLAARLAELGKDLQATGEELNRAARNVANAPPEVAWELIQRVAREQSTHVSDLFVIQTQIRAYLVELRPVAYEANEAITEALANRLDLKNRRARVVDAWRKIRVAADGLQSDLDVFLQADVATEPGSDNPLDFSSEASRYRVGLAFDGPLNRMAERNIYRAQLIEYQRARREFIASRDDIVRAIRLDLRRLAADRLNFQIARQQLIVAARQVELARVQLLAPGQAGDSSTTQDVLDALNSLLDAKNALIAIWVTYETDHLRLLLDTEALQLNQWGLYQDDDLNPTNSSESLDVPAPEPAAATVAGD